MLVKTLSVAALALTLTACGGGGTSGAGQNDSPSAALKHDQPSCGDVWKAGAILPTGYIGCMDANGMRLIAAWFTCKDGTKLYQFGDDFWAYGGQAIHEEAGGAMNSKAYTKAYLTCND